MCQVVRGMHQILNTIRMDTNSTTSTEEFCYISKPIINIIRGAHEGGSFSFMTRRPSFQDVASGTGFGFKEQFSLIDNANPE